MRRALRTLFPSSGRGSSSNRSSNSSSNRRRRYTPRPPLPSLFPEEDSPSLTLYLVIHQPPHGIRYLWSLSIYDEATLSWRTYQALQEAEGEPFRLCVHAQDPQRNPSILAMAMLSVVPRDWMEETFHACTMPIFPDVLCEGFHSQAHVSEMCGRLIEAGVIDSSEVDVAVEQLRDYYGRRPDALGREEEEEVLPSVEDDQYWG
ncbi:hypothetical protein ACJZ2D_010768 [Fusarium nematophilum]